MIKITSNLTILTNIVEIISLWPQQQMWLDIIRSVLGKGGVDRMEGHRKGKWRVAMGRTKDDQGKAAHG